MSDDCDLPSADEGDDSRRLIAEFRVAHPDFPLMETLESGPAFEITSLFQPGTSASVPEKTFAITAADYEMVEASLEADPSVSDVRTIDVCRNNRTYRIRFTDRTVLLSPTLGDLGLRIDAIDRDHDMWRFQVSAADRSTMIAALDYCRETSRMFTLDRLYASVAEESVTSPELSEQQRQTLLLAARQGYFDVPRGTSLEALGAELGVSDSAVSARLRKAINSLIEQSFGREALADHPQQTDDRR